MKTWIRRSLIGLFGLFGAVAVFGGVAACSGHGHPSHEWHAMSDADATQMKARLVDKAASRLDLDGTQKQRLAVLADRLQDQHKALIGGGGDPRAALQALVAGPQFDRARAQALLAAKTQAVQERGPAVVEALADFYDSLRPEQQQRLRELTTKRQHGWHR